MTGTPAGTAAAVSCTAARLADEGARLPEKPTTGAAASRAETVAGRCMARTCC
jgi:hypothetical protein